MRFGRHQNEVRLDPVGHKDDTSLDKGSGWVYPWACPSFYDMRRRGRRIPRGGQPVVPDIEEIYSKIKEKPKMSTWNNHLLVSLLLIASYVLWFNASSWWLYSVPTPLGHTAPSGVFSEARALEHVDVLSNQIGFRQVSTPGLELAKTYVLEICDHLASTANANEALVAEVDKEDVSGEYIESFFRAGMSSAFRNFTNIILYISPKGKEDQKALLINAHIDSGAGSPGASDCAVCVAVSMEIARMIAEGSKPLLTPVMFLFNGGEETLMQAASGFMRTSKWVNRVGAFINLESTGAGGMPMLFQYSGTWALKAYVKGAKYPRGTVVAQDVFRSRLIPADTDFRMFSQDYHGEFPGLDIATVLDAGAYHTSRDSYDRLIPGTTQEYGDSVAGVVDEFLKVMSDGVPEDSTKDFVYFDMLHSVMVLYDLDIGKWLHMLPVLVIGVGVFVQGNKYSGIPGIFKLQLWWGGIGVLKTLISVILAVWLPMGLGYIWVSWTGKPMFWFSNHLAACGVYVPMALIGTMMLWQPDALSLCCSSSLFGMSILLGAIGGGLTAVGVPSGYHLCWEAVFGGFMGMFVPEKLSSVWGVVPVLLFATVPITCSFTLLRVLCMHFMEKMSLMLASGDAVWGPYVPELIVSGLIGFSTWVTMTLLAPYIVGIQSRRYKWMGMGFLVMCSLSSLAIFGGDRPFSLYQPRMVHVDHVHNTTVGGSESYWMVSAWDPLPQADVLPSVFDSAEVQETNPDDWLASFPFNTRTRGYRVPAPPAKAIPWGSAPPRLVQVGSQDSDEHLSHRISLELQWEKPGWGVMSMTGPTLAWSFSKNIPTFFNKDGSRRCVLRFFQDADNPMWPFWVEIKPGGRLAIQLFISYFEETEELVSFCSQIPDYAAIISRTSAVSEWTFS